MSIVPDTLPEEAAETSRPPFVELAGRCNCRRRSIVGGLLRPPTDGSLLRACLAGLAGFLNEVYPAILRRVGLRADVRGKGASADDYHHVRIGGGASPVANRDLLRSKARNRRRDKCAGKTENNQPSLEMIQLSTPR